MNTPLSEQSKNSAEPEKSESHNLTPKTSEKGVIQVGKVLSLRVKNWLSSRMFWVKTGYRMDILNDGKRVDEVVIKYKDFYFSIFLDSETKEPTSDFSWSDDATMFNTPIRDILIARKKQ